MSKELILKAGEIVAQNTGSDSYCVLALIDAEGYPTASTITASKAQGIERLAFCTGVESSKAKRIASSNRASVCFNRDGAYNVSLVGTIEVIMDPDVKKEMWYDGLENHFSGPEDPNYCVLQFTTERYNLLVDWQGIEGTL